VEVPLTELYISVQHYSTLGVMIMKTISAADANRHFSRLLREVSQGEYVTVVSRGRAVATIAPVHARGRERQAAKRLLLERLRRQPAVGARNWTRDELYEN
jgi:prevent-host-death family protein